MRELRKFTQARKKAFYLALAILVLAFIHFSRAFEAFLFPNQELMTIALKGEVSLLDKGLIRIALIRDAKAHYVPDGFSKSIVDMAVETKNAYVLKSLSPQLDNASKQTIIEQLRASGELRFAEELEQVFGIQIDGQ